jgi:hypothetical protein
MTSSTGGTSDHKRTHTAMVEISGPPGDGRKGARPSPLRGGGTPRVTSNTATGPGPCGMMGRHHA